MNLPSQAKVLGNGFAGASSLGELMQGGGKQYFATGSSVFLKLRASGARWNASDRVNITW